MAKNEAIAKVIATDPYLKERKSPTAVDQQLYLKEVSFVCPLCGKILRHRKQKKANKLYEIAHIFPNSPTEEQYEQLSGLPRLGDNSESFENKIALCKDCHDQQDYHTTQADYLKLLDIKQHLLKLTDLHEATVLHQLTPFHRTFFRDGQRPFFHIQVTPFQGDELALA